MLSTLAILTSGAAPVNNVVPPLWSQVAEAKRETNSASWDYRGFQPGAA